MEIFTLFLIGLSLSLDAFSLSLAYGLIGLTKKRMFLASIVVGLFHFIMPLIGVFIGKKVLSFLIIKPKYIIAIIISLIILEMIKSLKENEKIEAIKMKLINMIIFAFFVSLDSFTIGIGIFYITKYPIYASMVFAVTSSMITYIGFNIGKYASKKVGNISKYIGIGILSILLLYFVLN